MTNTSMDVDGEVLTPREIAERSRAALRTSTVDSGILLDPPEIVGQIVDNLIPKTVLDSGKMIVRFQTSDIPVPHDDDTYELFQRKADTTPVLVEEGDFDPVAGRPPTKEIEVPTAGLSDDDLTKGSTTYEYMFVVYKGADDNADYSTWFPAEIDRYAPEHDKRSNNRFRPEAASFDNLAAGQIIDDEWLADNSALDLKVSTSYDWYRSDDNITVYAGAGLGNGTVIHAQALSSSGEVSIPTAEIPQLDGQYYIWYVLQDIVGNLSEESLPSGFVVRRRPRPALQDAVIPKGVLPDVIDLADLESPVFVEVPYTVNGQPSDLILPKVSNENGNTWFALTGQELGDSTPNKRLQFVVSTPRLLVLWGSSTVELPIVAEYDFSRGVESLVPSNPTASALDFSYRGPINPIFPGLENPNMEKVTVVGDSGTLNHITAEDRGKPATISTPMVDAASTWVPVGDEVARLWFDGTEVYSEELTAGPVSALTFEMPDSVIVGIGVKKAHWTIEEKDGRNVMRSLPTDVQVDAVRVEMPPPIVATYGTGSLVSCRSLRRPQINPLYNYELPVTVEIGAAYMPIGTVVTVKSHGTKDAAGLEIVPNTEYTGTYTILGNEPGNTFEILIEPYLTKIKPIQPTHDSGMPNGYIKVWYEVTIEGVHTRSLEFFNEVSLLNTSYHYCEGTPTQ